jgi:hypothetical protein
MSNQTKILMLILILGFSCRSDDGDIPDGNSGLLQIISATVGTEVLNVDEKTVGVEINKPVVISFSAKLDTSTVAESITIIDSTGSQISYQTNYLDEQSTISLKPDKDFDFLSDYTLKITDEIKGDRGESFPGVNFEFQTKPGILSLDSILINGKNFDTSLPLRDMDFDVQINAWFSDSVNQAGIEDYFLLLGPGSPVQLDISVTEGGRKVIMTNPQPLQYYTRYSFIIENDLTSENEFVFEGFRKPFFTRLDSSFKFTEIPDEELLTLIQEQTFKYFWDFGHPVSGLSRERNTSGEIVTIGGSGFGVMSFIVGVERGFISRVQAVERWQKIVSFLQTADRFHGVWPHWMNGSTGRTIPFSADDDGGDIVETAYMIQGLLTVRQYLDNAVPQEQELIDNINQLWEEVEWDWYTQGENVITWHWSPNTGFSKNLKVRGWNEALIVYVLATSSPTHPVEPDVYHEGWARNGGIMNGNSYYNIVLPLGPGYGGPLFFEHYSFLGLDPRNLSDQYADYSEQTAAHTLINRAYCIDNPLNWIGYNEACWGLTASDNEEGYSAHSPTNDRGVITPTAALSSFPYTPDESLLALRHFYYILGDRIWGEYGFYDAFNFTKNWVASSYLAIDQGPIIIMIENHRTAICWNLFMSNPEIQQGLDDLGYSY